MSPIAEAAQVSDEVVLAALEGLNASPKTLPSWLLYDEAGSRLFEQITELPEYYLTRTERALFREYAAEIFRAVGGPVTIAELGAGTATKTGILLRAALQTQLTLLYQPIDISPSALQEAQESLERELPGLKVKPQIANYVSGRIHVQRELARTVLALYIGSSIGNFSPAEAHAILANLRLQLQPGDHFLLGTDLGPGKQKTVAALIAAYDDGAGVSAAFNRNLLTRLNRELGADFRHDRFLHQARWNAVHSRMEMHLESTCEQTVDIPANSVALAQTLRFTAGETIHTENSYKFTSTALVTLLAGCGFRTIRTFHDRDCLYAVTLAMAV